MKHKSTDIKKTVIFEFEEEELVKIQTQIRMLYNEIVGQDTFIEKCPSVWDFGISITEAFDNGDI